MATTIDNGDLTDYDVATETVSGVTGVVQLTKILLGDSGANGGRVSSANPMPVSGPLTDAQLRATALPVSGTVAVTGVATEASLATVAAAIHNEDSAHTSGDAGIMLLGIRSDTDAPTASDGDYTTIKLDEEGRIKVASKPATYAATTGNITASAQTVFVNCERFSNLMLHCAGTFAGANIAFEGSLNSTNGTDGNWFGVQAVRSNANTIETATGVLAATPAYAWELSVNALKFFRVRATAFTSGTQTWTMIPGTYATEPIPGAQVTASQPVSGTVTIGTSVTPGVAATNLGKAEDAVHASGDTGVAILAVRTDAPGTTSSATGDYDVLHTCSSGALHTCFIPTDRTGMSRARIVSAASTNGTLVKSSVGTLWGLRLYNNTSVKKFFKLYNKASAPTVGTDTPVETIIIPADGGLVLSVAADEFSLGIGYGITNGIADSDTTAVALNDVHGVLLYK